MERNQLTLLIRLHFHVDTLHLGVKTVKKFTRKHNASIHQAYLCYRLYATRHIKQIYENFICDT